MENLEELKILLAAPKDIVIVTHRNPDGDAIGASLAMYHYLNMHGHAVHVVSPSDYPGFLGWLPDADRIIIYDSDQAYCKQLIEQAGIIFCLDFNSLERIDKVGELIAPLPSATKIVMIDHHLYPEPFADFVMSDTTASSTCEMVFDFISQMGDKKLIDETIGECIFTGILTDTGSFKYSTSGKLFSIVSELIEIGVDDYKLQDLIFNSLDEKNLRLLGHCLYNRLEILEEYNTGIITLTKDDYSSFEIDRGDTEGIVNYLLKIKGIKLAVFIMEQPAIVKLSFRSKGKFSVQEIARKHFRGGGHKNAAGGASYLNLKATVKKFKELLPQYKDGLCGT